MEEDSGSVAWTAAWSVFWGVLIIITLFRRRLSINDQYRETEEGLFPVVPAASEAAVEKAQTDGAGGAAAVPPEANPPLASRLWRRPSFSRVGELFEKQTSLAANSSGFGYLNSFFSSGTNTNNINNNNRNCPDRLSRLSPDCLLSIAMFMSPADLGALSSVSRSLAKDLKADQVWQQLWIQRYGAMWSDPKIQYLRLRRGLDWTPRQRPTQGWFVFYLEFEACWLEWLLAGMCTSDLCVVGLGGSIYDITAFLPRHPGSIETLLDACGGDGTEQFADIGHSSDAVELARLHRVYSMPAHLTCGQYQDSSRLNRHFGSRRGYLTKFQSAMRREQTVAAAAAELSERHRLQAVAQRRAAAGADGGAAGGGGGGDEATPWSWLWPSTALGPTAPSAAGPAATAAGASTSPSTSTTKIAPSIEGYTTCEHDEPHVGRARACYDPVQQRWAVWWTCCGRCQG